MVGAWRWLAYEIVMCTLGLPLGRWWGWGGLSGRAHGSHSKEVRGPQHQSFCKNTQNDNQDIRTK